MTRATASLLAMIQLMSATPAAAVGRAHGWQGGTCARPATTSHAAPEINSIHHPIAAFPLLGNSDVAVRWEVRAGGLINPPPASQGHGHWRTNR